MYHPIEPDQNVKLLDESNSGFSFSCHPAVSCYLQCCHRVTLLLYPYDIIRLKQCLGLHSTYFLQRYVTVVEGSHPYFPSLLLTMENKEGYPCPFLSEHGCGVYKDRPSACRTYPLERGVEFDPLTSTLRSHYALIQHRYCLGHHEHKQFTVRQWERDQHLYEFNLMNDLWAKTDALFATNPWQGESKGGPLQRLAFMVCYNIDDFRAYVEEHNLIKQYKIDKRERRRIKEDDAALLQFGFLWLQHTLGPQPLLSPS